MIRHKDSHLDHGLTPAQVEYLLERFSERAAFFIETVELPEDLGVVWCGLHGPCMGDEPVTGDKVTWRARGSRPYWSRLVDRAPRTTRKVTVIAGPHDGQPCVLFTAFGGPSTPQEPGELVRQIAALMADPTTPGAVEKMEGLLAKHTASVAFWSEHALSHPHTRDEDCDEFLRADGTCTVCGVAHGEPCDACGGRGFHAAGCAA